MKEANALSFPEGWIAMDVDKFENSIEEKEVLAHEMGHIETGSFYNFFSPFDIKAKHENKANKQAIKKLVPLDELKEALINGFTEIWQLAEYFDVSTIFMTKCIAYYKDVSLL